jgi:hypothetical protein
MSNEKMFEVAARTKMRFPFKGPSSVEDLWDLSVENLDVIFKQLNAQLKQSSEESLLNKRTSEDEALALKIDIVKYIVSVKQNEENERVQAKAKKEKKDKIIARIAELNDAEFNTRSKEDLIKELNDMDQ